MNTHACLVVSFAAIVVTISGCPCALNACSAEALALISDEDQVLDGFGRVVDVRHTTQSSTDKYPIIGPHHVILSKASILLLS